MERKFNVGDLVFVSKLSRAKGKSPKLQSVWDGPFVITKKHGPVLNSSRKSVLHSDRLKPYRSNVFPGWVNRIRKEITTDTNLATLDEDDALLPSVMEDLTATSNTSEAEEDAPPVTSTGPQRTSARPTGARGKSPAPSTSPLRTNTGPVVRNEALKMPKDEGDQEANPRLEPLRTRKGRQVKAPKRLDL